MAPVVLPLFLPASGKQTPQAPSPGHLFLPQTGRTASLGRKQGLPSPPNLTRQPFTWGALLKARSPRCFCSSSTPALGRLLGPFPAQPGLGSSPSSRSCWRGHNVKPRLNHVPHHAPAPAPCSDPTLGCRGGTHARPALPPSLQMQQETMHLLSAQTTLGDSRSTSEWLHVWQGPVTLPRL